MPGALQYNLLMKNVKPIVETRAFGSSLQYYIKREYLQPDFTLEHAISILLLDAAVLPSTVLVQR